MKIDRGKDRLIKRSYSAVYDRSLQNVGSRLCLSTRGFAGTVACDASIFSNMDLAI